MNSKMDIEKLEFDKTETELTIQGLHKTSEKLEKIKEEIQIGDISWVIIEQGLRETNKQIEWNEQILDEINGSIQFEVINNGFL